MAAPSFITPMSMPLAVMPQSYAMMGAVSPVSLVQAAPQQMVMQQSAPQTCAASTAAASAASVAAQANATRIEDLEIRMNELRKRVNTLQTSVEEQTELLHVIADRVKQLPRD